MQLLDPIQASVPGPHSPDSGCTACLHLCLLYSGSRSERTHGGAGAYPGARAQMYNRPVKAPVQSQPMLDTTQTYWPAHFFHSLALHPHTHSTYVLVHQSIFQIFKPREKTTEFCYLICSSVHFIVSLTWLIYISRPGVTWDRGRGEVRGLLSHSVN